jgi:DNA-directed RNA polymerase subunit RPC12/RpoP
MHLYKSPIYLCDMCGDQFEITYNRKLSTKYCPRCGTKLDSNILKFDNWEFKSASTQKDKNGKSD